MHDYLLLSVHVHTHPLTLIHTHPLTLIHTHPLTLIHTSHLKAVANLQCGARADRRDIHGNTPRALGDIYGAPVDVLELLGGGKGGVIESASLNANEK